VSDLSNSEVEAAVKELEQKLERLRVFYEQYFLGISKREPTVQLKDCVRLIRLLDQQSIRNTAMRYRFRSLTQKFNTYRTYWNRTLRAIEAGTYKRDVARAARSMAKRGLSVPQMGRVRTVGDFERAIREAASTPTEEPASKPAKAGAPALTERTAPPRAGSAAANSPTTSTAPDLSKAEVESIYQRFIAAKKRCGESTRGIHLETLSRTLERQLPRLRDKHGGRAIRFEVVIRGGRAVLKASPK
jgi:hypothetical protein